MQYYTAVDNSAPFKYRKCTRFLPGNKECIINDDAQCLVCLGSIPTSEPLGNLLKTMYPTCSKQAVTAHDCHGHTLQLSTGLCV